MKIVKHWVRYRVRFLGWDQVEKPVWDYVKNHVINQVWVQVMNQVRYDVWNQIKRSRLE